MRTRRRLAALAVAVVALAGAAAWGAAQRPLSVEVAGTADDVAIEVFGLGTVEARVLSRVGFEVSGTLRELQADARDFVPRGTVLAALDDDEQRARLGRAEAGVDRARAEVARAEAKLVRARAHLAQRRQVNDRRQELVRKAAVSVEAAEDARTEVELATADVTVAATEAEVARAALRDAEQQRAVEAALLRQHELTAPYDAVVVQRHRELGAVVAPGEAVFTLIDPASVWALVYVDEAASGGLRVGQPARLALRSLPGSSFPARVARIDLESDRVGEERRVYLACEGCPADLHLGEQVEARITIDVVAKARLVPENAVTRQAEGRGDVWTVEDGRLARRSVALGRKTLDGRLELLGGLPPGVEVVAAVQDGFRPGRRARATEPAP